ncbi:hypothetical protein TKK_0004491 [Trichogramma kaykai]
MAKRKHGPGQGELHPIPPGCRPFEKVHIDHVGPFITTPRNNKHPQANGLVEKLNQTLLPIMKIETNSEQNDWDVKLEKIARDINSTVSVATGKTPYECVLGYLPRFDDGNMRELTVQNEKYDNPVKIQMQAKKRIEEEQARYKAKYDVNRYKNVKFHVGDIVFMKRNAIATGQSTKLQSSFGGPFVIIGIYLSDTYKIKYLNDSDKRMYETTAHVSQLKIWKNSDTVFSDDEYENENENENENQKINDNDKKRYPKRERKIPNRFKDFVLK